MVFYYLKTISPLKSDFCIDYEAFVLTLFYFLFFFFQQRAQLAYFDDGDIICKEGEMPQGIYLIISGTAIVRDYLFFIEVVFWNM